MSRREKENRGGIEEEERGVREKMRREELESGRRVSNS